MTKNEGATTDPRCEGSPAPYVIYLNNGCVSQSRIDTLAELKAYEQQPTDNHTNDGGLVVLICLPLLLALMWLNR